MQKLLIGARKWCVANVRGPIIRILVFQVLHQKLTANIAHVVNREAARARRAQLVTKLPRRHEAIATNHVQVPTAPVDARCIAATEGGHHRSRQQTYT